jgi:hypothetical protein
LYIQLRPYFNKKSQHSQHWVELIVWVVGLAVWRVESGKDHNPRIVAELALKTWGRAG